MYTLCMLATETRRIRATKFRSPNAKKTIISRLVNIKRYRKGVAGIRATSTKAETHDTTDKVCLALFRLYVAGWR